MTPSPGPGRSTATTVALAIGGVAAFGVLVVGVLLGAVVFLGTSAEPRFESIDMDDPGGGGTLVPLDDDDPTDDPTDGLPSEPGAGSGGLAQDEPDPFADEADEADEAAPPVTSPTATEGTPSEATSLLAAERIMVQGGGEWLLSQVEAVAPDAGLDAGACRPEGWLTGATDRYRTHYGRPETGNPQALTLSLTTYESDVAAQAEMARVASDVYRACEVEERVGEVAVANTGATVVPLAPDPQAPGAIYQIDLVGAAQPFTEYEITLFVGRQRGHLDFCGCADISLEGQLDIARQVASAMAEAQGLPVPA